MLRQAEAVADLLADVHPQLCPFENQPFAPHVWRGCYLGHLWLETEEIRSGARDAWRDTCFFSCQLRRFHGISRIFTVYSWYSWESLIDLIGCQKLFRSATFPLTSITSTRSSTSNALAAPLHQGCVAGCWLRRSSRPRPLSGWWNSKCLRGAVPLIRHMALGTAVRQRRSLALKPQGTPIEIFTITNKY